MMKPHWKEEAGGVDPPVPGPVWSDEELICSVCHNLQTNPGSSWDTSSLLVTEVLKIEWQNKDPLVGPNGSTSVTEFVLWGVKVQPSWEWPIAWLRHQPPLFCCLEIEPAEDCIEEKLK